MSEQNDQSKTEGNVEEMEVAEESFGFKFHKWPFLISLGITALLYLVVYFLVEENPPVFDPAELPPPPGS